MLEVGPEHPITYRQEIVTTMFQIVKAGDSGALVGAASMGKSRLLRFILRPEIQQAYLDEQSSKILWVLVDCNRLAEISEWGFYELLLTSLIESCSKHPDTTPLRSELNTLRREAIVNRDPVLARRDIELAIHMVCQEKGITLCFILDEFDEVYQALPAPALANLRALRDSNKYQLCYLLILRNPPARLRSVADHEGFYEILSRAIIGLHPYAPADAERVVDQLERRKGQRVPSTFRSRLLALSGGHPGLIVALFDAVAKYHGSGEVDWQKWAFAQPTIQEECRKLWDGLLDDEHRALNHIAHGLKIRKDVSDVLLLKGLILPRAEGHTIFSTIFAEFVLIHGSLQKIPVQVDELTRVVWIGEQQIEGLTAREFDLLAFLYHRLGQVCTRTEILAALYPHEHHGQDVDLQENRVDTLVKRIREKIEPVPQRPRYLLTVRGKGYKLVNVPSPATRGDLS